MKLTKYLYDVLTMKYTLMELMMKFIRWLTFIKTVLCCEKIKERL